MSKQTVTVQVIHDDEDNAVTYFIGPFNVATPDGADPDTGTIDGAKRIWKEFVSAFHVCRDCFDFVFMVTPFGATDKRDKATTSAEHPELRVVIEQEVDADELPEFAEIFAKLQERYSEVEW